MILNSKICKKNKQSSFKYFPSPGVKEKTLSDSERNWLSVSQSDDPKTVLIEATATVTSEKACGWIVHSGYIL